MILLLNILDTLDDIIRNNFLGESSGDNVLIRVDDGVEIIIANVDDDKEFSSPGTV